MSTFIIRNKVTKEHWSASSGKNSWRKINHAKAAFSYSQGYLKRNPLLKEFVDKLDKYKSLYFDDQDVYEIVELLSESEDKLREIEVVLLHGLLNKIPDSEILIDIRKIISGKGLEL